MKGSNRPIKVSNCLFCNASLNSEDSLVDFLMGENVLCAKCRKELTPLLKYRMFPSFKVFALYDYNQMARQMMLQYKGCYDEALSVCFVHEYLYLLKFKYRNCTLIPIPSSKEKLEERGFHHVDKMFESLNLPICDCLEKAGDISQKNLNSSQRESIYDLMRLKDVPLPQGKVVLIDDVCTTGNSLNAAYQLLKDKVKIKEACVVFTKIGNNENFRHNNKNVG